ncbi:MAG: DUF2232 domain-containing protein [Bacillota bacterium]|nr:DUF2232 domain-containing protein [Bacillota bacterium]
MYLSLIFILTLIIPFIAMPKHIKMNILPPYRVILLSIMGIGVMTALVLMVASFSGQGLYAQLHEVAKLISADAATNPMIIDALGMKEMSEAEISQMLLTMYDKGFLVLPVAVLLMGAIVSYIAYIILSNIIGKKTEVKKMPKFREFTFPHGTAMAVMIMYIIGWIMLESESEMGEMLFANFSALFDIVFVLQGIAVVLMFFHFKKIPQAIAVVVSGFMVITSIGKTFIVLLGMADMFFGLRLRMGSRPSRR